MKGDWGCMRKITNESIVLFNEYLISEEKALSTIKKYKRNIEKFKIWLGENELCKTIVITYKSHLCEQYAPASVNICLSSLNSYFDYMEWHDLRVKNLKIQKEHFIARDRELTKDEYFRLLRVAKNNNDERLYLLMQTICSTGIRVSELHYITIDAITKGLAVVNCKGKQRTVFLPNDLCEVLKQYTLKEKIKNGTVFITRNGNPLDRSNIWSDMKKLCKIANIPKTKVYPHNLRHLFARTYYRKHNDIVGLADILGHDSINTTRIYTLETGETHKDQISQLGLLECCVTT